MTKLKHLTKQQQETFHRVIANAVSESWTAKDVQAILAEKLGKVFVQRMIQRYMERRRTLSVPPPSHHGTGLEPPEGGDTVKEIGTGSDTKEVWLESQRVVTLEDALKKGGTIRGQLMGGWSQGSRQADSGDASMASESVAQGQKGLESLRVP